MGNFIQSLIGPTQGEALDVACGAGANIFHLAQILPGFHWSGVDIAGEVLFPIGSPFFRSKDLEVDLKVGDVYKLEDYFGGGNSTWFSQFIHSAALIPMMRFCINCSR